MKKCKNITGWTDYPIVELGDTPRLLAPMRRVKVIAYDGNKYVIVIEMKSGVEFQMKAGYLYQGPDKIYYTKYGYRFYKRVSTRKLARSFGYKVASYGCVQLY
jgi:hypothetical protein